MKALATVQITHSATQLLDTMLMLYDSSRGQSVKLYHVRW